MSEFSEKNILVTGGTRRIGESIVRHLHQRGARIIVHFNSSEIAARELQDELNGIRSESVFLIHGDLRDIPAWINNLRQLVNKLEGLDCLVNNAARFYPTPMSSATDSQFYDLMESNLMAPFFLGQALAPHLRKTGGCIVNITDIYADRPLAGHSIYSATKAGLVSLTRSMAAELGPEIRVNGVSPGAILWPEGDQDEIAHQRLVSSTPLKRVGDPMDIARTVEFLVYNADFITGQVINVDGGRTVSA